MNLFIYNIIACTLFFFPDKQLYTFKVIVYVLYIFLLNLTCCSKYMLKLLHVSFVKDLLDGKNSEGMTPLFQATSCNNLECVQFLVTSGANIDARDNVGRTPVALAAYQVAASSNFSIFYILCCISPMIP